MRVAIIGGGVAGVMAAGEMRKRGEDVTLFEKNEKLLKKMFITGKGRCNITNYIMANEFLESVVSNPKFLYSAIKTFDCYSAYGFFEELGVPLKVEHGDRVFPLSDKSSDVTRAFSKWIEDLGVKIKLFSCITSVEKIDDKFFISLGAEKIEFDRVIITTGGLSYQATGSTGDGYTFAEKFGHTIIEPRPALIGLNVKQNYVKELSGVSLKNVRLSAKYRGKTIFSELGEMLFTHFGISGPLVLSLSSYINRLTLSEVSISLDLKPALSYEEMDKRIQRDFAKYINKAFKNSLQELTIKSLIPVIIDLSGIDENKPVNQITAAERSSLIDSFKNIALSPASLRPINEAIVTAGGVSTTEINPKTMESKLIKGLYFAGEVIDVDGLTGGFNIQIALSTGYLAGNAE